MPDISTQQFLYHLTDIKNLDSIFKDGLKSRSNLRKFSDVADPEIIKSRQGLKLEKYVPFHFFAKNPFDGRVHRNNPQKTFVLITVNRSLALAHNWSIIPRHPLSGANITVLNYEKGMKTIDWEAMNTRNYSDEYCKCVCMAECLSPKTVSASDFHSIYVPNAKTESTVNALKKDYEFKMYVNLNSHMFPGA